MTDRDKQFVYFHCGFKSLLIGEHTIDLSGSNQSTQSVPHGFLTRTVILKVDYDSSFVFYLFSGVERRIPNKIESDWVRLRSNLFDWFDNRTHSVQFCSITEPNWTISVHGVQLDTSGYLMLVQLCLIQIIFGILNNWFYTAVAKAKQNVAWEWHIKLLSVS